MANTEQKISLPEQVSDLEGILRRVTEKEPRLAKGLRTYLARLKNEGRFEEVMRIAQAARGKKIEERYGEAEKKLNLEILEIGNAKEEEQQYLHEIRAIWLASAVGILSSSERAEEIIEVLDSKAPNLKAFLEGKLLDIRTDMQPFLPPAIKTRR